MRYLLGLDLHNVVSFKHLSVDFTPGLTYVRGLNLDSDPANPTGNGAGKSLMFSALANLLYQSTPLSLKKRAKKDILRTKDSRIGLLYKPSEDGPEYEIIQSGSGYVIYKDGEDLQVRGAPKAEALIRSLFPLSEIEFYSTCYLSTQRPYLIQQDTDSNRLQHFTDLFKLDQYSEVRDYFAVQQKTIADNETKLSVLEQRLLSLKKKLTATKSTIGAEEYAASKANYTKLTSQIDTLQKQRFEVVTQSRALNSLLQVEQKLDALREQYTFSKAPDVMVASLRGMKKASKEWEQYDHRLTHTKSLRKKLEQKLAAIEVPSESEKQLSKRLASLDEQMEVVEAEFVKLSEAKRLSLTVSSELSEVVQEFDTLAAEFKAVKKVDEEYDYSADIGSAKASLRLESLLEHDHEEGKCPTCLGDLDLENLTILVTQAKKALPRLEALRSAQSLLKKKNKLQTSLDKLGFDRAKWTSARNKIQALQDEIDQCTAAVELWEEHSKISNQLVDLALPDAPASTRPKFSVEELDTHIELCREIQKHLEAKNALLENHQDFKKLKSAASVKAKLAQVEKEETELVKKTTNFEQARSKFAEDVSQHDQYLNTVKVYRKEYSDTKAEIEKLRPSVQDKKLIAVLLKAYGAKGLRAKAASSVCELFQTNLNHYRDLIFAEPFSFSVVSTDTGISILVDRNNGKPDAVSDVRNLSGAESNSFRLLCLVALLPLIPDSRRVNMLLLDEPTSHQDEASRQIFNERFLPVLKELVPSIYVITPHTDDRSPDSSEWLVTKQSGESTLNTTA